VVFKCTANIKKTECKGRTEVQKIITTVCQETSS
jgi:hypothetical protein